MARKSAGILFHRIKNGCLEVLLVHPGGPFWVHKDDGAWSIPKGEFEENENPLHTAIREVKEELGIVVSGSFLELTPLKQKSGKMVFCWALEKDFDTSVVKSNYFELEWPPKSGVMQRFPEIDKAEWFDAATAKKKIITGQQGFIEQLIHL